MHLLETWLTVTVVTPKRLCCSLVSGSKCLASCFWARNNVARRLLPLIRLHTVAAVTDEGLFGFTSEYTVCTADWNSKTFGAASTARSLGWIFRLFCTGVIKSVWCALPLEVINQEDETSGWFSMVEVTGLSSRHDFDTVVWITCDNEDIWPAKNLCHLFPKFCFGTPGTTKLRGSRLSEVYLENGHWPEYVYVFQPPAPPQAPF